MDTHAGVGRRVAHRCRELDLKQGTKFVCESVSKRLPRREEMSPNCFAATIRIAHILHEHLQESVRAIYSRTGMPRPARYSLTSRMPISPKWNTDAASTASALPSAIAS